MSSSAESPIAVRPPALARGGIDRAAEERTDTGLIERLRADAGARVVAVHGDRVPVDASGALRTVAVGEVREDSAWAFLGRDATGAAMLLAATASNAASPVREPAAFESDAGWASLRAVGGTLSATDAGVVVEAVALGRWLVDAPFCSHCGARTVERSAGWARHCPVCGREHFPRTDPAVIVGVISPDGSRLLLGKNAVWAERNVYSTFAGFVEAGESLESAIIREVHEEAGVEVGSLDYRGSQSWPYPRSLMLGFHAVAADPDVARADGEEIVDVRWFTRDEVLAALRGEGDVVLPGTSSIAHRLIADWAGAPE
ncbi:NAD(+) diphosphatase [Microbacterium sp. VKM Ac-2870]|uniref:NAD(+) diphosphatase n=1 Tax=Microbacterium sp. VKM Ac-2870 TaxID=2783825 RepID=UPI00188C4717|nr:NAD(+) diphosphatase [Microbacterium sp. VKM Ac-2870]MBF4560581.1 NAD(+) diphosphatase [Microbacterium sp. VKM Ac-2870]